MTKKTEGAKEGKRKTISFEGDVKEIIEEYRRKQKDIPTFTEAVNEIIKGSKKKDETKRS